jgi:diguanylate cyclase (GGDEF)-like protein
MSPVEPSEERSPDHSLVQRISAALKATFVPAAEPGRRQFDGGDLDLHMQRIRKDAYRYVLVALAVMLAPINAHNYYDGRLLPALAGLVVLALILVNIYLMSRDKPPFLSPLTVLLIAVALVILSLVYGQILTLYWMYPLLVALPVLLKTRLAVWLGVLLGLLVMPFVWLRFDPGTAFIVCLSIGHTWLISGALMYAVSEQSKRLGELTITDALTGAFSRRHLHNRARHALRAWQRYHRPATLLLLNIDNFSSVNEEVGEEVGDHALCAIVEILRQRLRRLDLVFRYGGDDFAVILVETDESRAMPVAEELRSHIERAKIVPGRTITISMAVCDVSQADNVDSWLKLGSRALYQAKLQGRNQVVIATPGAIPVFTVGGN